MLNFAPRLRDTLSRGFWIGPTTLLARFAEGLRRAPAKGGEEKFEMRNAECENWPSVAPNLADSGGAMEGLRWKGGLTMKG